MSAVGNKKVCFSLFLLVFICFFFVRTLGAIKNITCHSDALSERHVNC